MFKKTLVFVLLGCILAGCATFADSQNNYPTINQKNLDVYSCPVFGDKQQPRELHVFAVIQGEPPDNMVSVSIFCSTGQSTEDSIVWRHGLTKTCSGGHVKIGARNGTFSQPVAVKDNAPSGWSGSVYYLSFAASEDTDGDTLQLAVISLECIDDGRPIRPLPPAEPQTMPLPSIV